MSAWEIAIKARLGRLRAPADLESFFAQQLALNAFEVLPVGLRHVLRVASLPDLHRDPFDRMLVAQSQVEALVILTADEAVARYDVQTRW